MGAELNESDYSNPRRLIRAIETQGSPRSKKPLRKDTFIIGLAPEPSLLHGRIEKRVDEMVENGFVDEVSEIINEYSLAAPGVSGIGYRAFADYITGKKTLDQAKADFVRGDTQLAKRQVTWFKRNKDIHWASSASEGLKLCEQFLKGEV
jgi:tRNA dimethylallyltransferase